MTRRPAANTRGLAFASALVAALVALGCGGLGGDGGDGGELPTGELELGSAAFDGTSFIELADGSDVELIPGAQGGFHAWLNVRVYGVSSASREVYIQREARLVSDDTLVLRGLRQAFDVPDSAMSGWWESPSAAPAFMCPSPLGVKVFDEPVRYRVTLQDDDGTVLAEDQIVLVPRCPQGEARDFCISICSG